MFFLHVRRRCAYFGLACLHFPTLNLGRLCGMSCLVECRPLCVCCPGAAVGGLVVVLWLPLCAFDTWLIAWLVGLGWAWAGLGLGLGWAWLGLAGLGWALAGLGWAWLGWAWLGLGWAWLGLGWAWLGLARLACPGWLCWLWATGWQH